MVSLYKRRPLSAAQAALVERLRGGRLLIYSQNGCYIEAPYSEEDGRTVGGLIDRGILKHDGQERWPSLSTMWVLRDDPARPTERQPEPREAHEKLGEDE